MNYVSRKSIASRSPTVPIMHRTDGRRIPYPNGHRCRPPGRGIRSGYSLYEVTVGIPSVPNSRRENRSRVLRATGVRGASCGERRYKMSHQRQSLGDGNAKEIWKIRKWKSENTGMHLYGCSRYVFLQIRNPRKQKASLKIYRKDIPKREEFKRFFAAGTSGQSAWLPRTRKFPLNEILNVRRRHHDHGVAPPVRLGDVDDPETEEELAVVHEAVHADHLYERLHMGNAEGLLLLGEHLAQSSQSRREILRADGLVARRVQPLADA